MMTLCMTAPHPPASRLEKSRHQDLRDRALALLRAEIQFVAGSDFHLPCGNHDQSAWPLENETAGTPADLPAHLRRMCALKLLTREQEQALFREMNYLKFRANSLRARIDPDHIDPEMIATIERLLQEAQAIRDHIIQSNTRLVMSIVKKFVTPQMSFDDLLSDGIMTLMQTVEKFDYSRGFRFSTYAYRSIARNAYRAIMSARKEETRVTRDAEDWAFEQVEQRSSSQADKRWEHLRELTASMLKHLDRRERFIIRSRYALGAHRTARTFQDLARRLGVSKERVRQLEQRALAKLRAMAAELEIDHLFDEAVV